jgi:epoxide hydrolase 4
MLKDTYANANGVRLHYVASGTGPLILFLHGFPQFWYAWKNQLSEFGKDHHAVALDMRGFNLSDKPADVAQYRLDVLVEDIRAFAAQLSDAKKFVLVGHDWGGFVAWAAYPRALEKLQSSTPRTPPFSPSKRPASTWKSFAALKPNKFYQPTISTSSPTRSWSSLRKMACRPKTSPNTSKPGRNPERSPAASTTFVPIGQPVSARR